MPFSWLTAAAPYARNRLEHFLDGRSAVAAHHTGDLHRLFHGCFLLECVEFDGFYFFIPAGVAKLEKVQTQRVGYHAEAATGSWPPRRTSGSASGPAESSAPAASGNADRVVEERPEQVLRECCAAWRGSGGWRRAHRTGGSSSAPRPPHRWPRPCPAPMATPISACVSAGRVVDAVAYHGDLALALQPCDDAPPCPRAARPRRPRSTPACAPMACAVLRVVAGQHAPRAMPMLLQLAHRLRAVSA